MRVHSSTRYAAFAALMGALACAGNKVKTDETGAARDTTSVNDSTSLRDTLKQGTGAVQDTAGRSGMERVDTTSQPAQVNPQAQTDTSSFGRDTTGTKAIPGDTSAMDTTGMNPSSSGVTGLDSTGSPKAGDTTGYSPTQQSRDTTSR